MLHGGEVSTTDISKPQATRANTLTRIGTRVCDAIPGARDVSYRDIEPPARYNT